MCYDLSFSASIESIYDYLPEIRKSGQLDISFESTYHKVAQGYPKWPVVINSGGELQLRKFEWGVIPGYMKTPEEIRKGRKWMVNARSEKILDGKSYWGRIRKNRCLVPATGFFEHRAIEGWKNKVPYYIKVKGREIFFLAGLYTYAHVPNVETGEMPGTFTVITRDANTVMAKIHNSGDNSGRMPLILSPELEKAWLDPGLTDDAMQQILAYALPSEQLDYWTVDAIRKAKPDDEDVLQQVDYTGRPGWLPI